MPLFPRLARFTPTEQQRLFGLTLAIGGVCGLVAVAFHLAIRWVEHVTVEHAFAAGAPWVIAVLVGGALLAGVMLRAVPGARGSGIPQVKVAYAVKGAKLRVRDSLAKFAIATVQVGTGSSLGREGPTVQICAGVATALGRLAKISTHNLKLLLPVGAAAGIAAAFNAPIAAVTFTIEEIVGKLDQTLLSGVIVAAAVAAVVERSILGVNPVIAMPGTFGLDHASSLVLYAALGVACALVSVAFTDGLLRLRARFRASRIPAWAQPAVGAAITAAIAVGVVTWSGVHGITGGGYPALVAALSGKLVVGTLLVVCAAKLVATVFSYSSGGAGGVFAPTLALGALLGGAIGVLDVQLLEHGSNELGAFAIVGMGAMFAGVIRAPITSVLIIIEMTGGYSLTLPLMIANMIAYAIAQRLRPTQIYEALLEQDGVDLHRAEPSDGLTIAGLSLHTTFATLAPDASPARMLAVLESAQRQSLFPVVDAGRLVGVLTLDDLTELAADIDADDRAGDLARAIPALGREDTLARALSLMNEHAIRELPIVDREQHVIGLLDEATIAHAYVRARSSEPAASRLL